MARLTQVGSSSRVTSVSLSTASTAGPLTECIALQKHIRPRENGWHACLLHQQLANDSVRGSARLSDRQFQSASSALRPPSTRALACTAALCFAMCDCPGAAPDFLLTPCCMLVVHDLLMLQC